MTLRKSTSTNRFSVTPKPFSVTLKKRFSVAPKPFSVAPHRFGLAMYFLIEI